MNEQQTTEITESWKNIPGFPGYQASTLGRVRSVEREVEYVRKGRPVLRTYPGLVLATRREGARYVKVNLCIDGEITTHNLHVLIALAFHGRRPAGMQVRHLDDDKANNVPGNLAYGTQVDNAQDAIRNGRNHNLNKTADALGHLLEGENLSPSHLRDNQRVCRSCHRARATATWLRTKKGVRIDAEGLTALRHAYYDALMSTQEPRELVAA